MSEPAPTTIYAIGDSHGCYARLADLLSRIVADMEADPPPGPVELVLLGDYVDRGPDSAGVLSSLVWMERASPLPTVFLKGNHEQMMLGFLADPVEHRGWLTIGGAETVRSYGVETGEDADAVELRDRLLDAMPAAHLDFLQRLRRYHETTDHLFVHAGVRPGVALEEQQDDDLFWIREGFLDSEGPAAKRVVHGHSWTGAEPVVRANRIGVDTGAYKTGVLTAARLRGKELSFLQSTGEAA